MARYLLDTNVAFAIVSGEGAALERFSKLAIADVALSAVSYSELLAACADMKNARPGASVALLAANIDILPFDRAAADAYGALMRRLAHKRRRMLDRLIAAHALSLGRTLITGQPADFDDAPGLAIEDWTR